MTELSNSTIDKSCKMVRSYFPSTFILDVFKDITADPGLKNFPNARLFEENISRTKKIGTKIMLKAVSEISTYFYEHDLTPTYVPTLIRELSPFPVLYS